MSSSGKSIGFFLILFQSGLAIAYFGTTEYSTTCDPMEFPCYSILIGLGAVMLGLLIIWPFAYRAERGFKLPGRPTISGTFLLSFAVAPFLAIPVTISVGNFWDSCFAIAFFLAAALFPLRYWWNGAKRRCPSCRRWYARVLLDSELLHTRDSWETVYDTVYANTTTATYDDKGQRHDAQSTSSTTVPRTARVTYQKHLNSFQCGFCGYKWSTTTSLRFVH